MFHSLKRVYWKWGAIFGLLSRFSSCLRRRIVNSCVFRLYFALQVTVRVFLKCGEKLEEFRRLRRGTNNLDL